MERIRAGIVGSIVICIGFLIVVFNWLLDRLAKESEYPEPERGVCVGCTDCDCEVDSISLWPVNRSPEEAIKLRDKRTAFYMMDEHDENET